jgi:acyl carrier protein
MEAESLADQVKRLIATRMAVRVEQLSADTRLLQDIGADGADGWELMEEFGERFGVDLSEFEPGLHFGPEGDPLTGLVASLFRPRWARFIPITVEDLVQAARSGKWQTPSREEV